MATAQGKDKSIVKCEIKNTIFNNIEQYNIQWILFLGHFSTNCKTFSLSDTRIVILGSESVGVKIKAP